MGRLMESVQPGVLCAFDFDGTIAPIVDDPAAARIPPSLLRRLAALAEFTPVAIITGRSVEDISLRLDFFPEFVIGNHGLEGLPGWEEREQQYRRDCASWVRDLQLALDSGLYDPAVWVEDKTYSVSIHYRQARNAASTKASLLRLIERTAPAAKIVDGKFVFNILPRGAPDKGDALLQLREATQAPAAIYVGDDVTDEAVFNLPHKDLLTIRVGEGSATAAEFHLSDISEMAAFLDMLLKRLSEQLLQA